MSDIKNLYNDLTNFYNVNDENFKEFMAKIYDEMLANHRDVKYVKEHLYEEIVKILDEYLVDGKIKVNIRQVVDDFLNNGAVINDINTNIEDINTNIEDLNTNIEDLNMQLDTIETRKTNKAETKSIQEQIDNLVLASGGDSNLEVVQGRTNSIGITFPVINNRLESIEKLINTGYVYFNVDGWVNGGINNTGVDTYFPSRIRTTNYYTFPYEANLFIEGLSDNYAANIFYYTKSGDTYTFVGSTGLLKNVDITTNPNYHYRFVLGTIDGSGTATSDLALNYVFKVDYLKPNYIFDKIQDETSKLENIINKGYEDLELNLSWEVGTFDSNGNVAYFPSRIRSTKYFKSPTDVKVNINVGSASLGVRLFWYSYNGSSYTYVGSTPTFSNSIDIELSKDYYYKFTISKIDNSSSGGDLSWGNLLNIRIDKKISYAVEKKDLTNQINITREMQSNIASALIREKNRNPFEFKTFDKGYISIVFDDLRNDIDLVASIFAEFNYPLCISAIPQHLNNMASGLKTASNGFETGMRMKAIMQKVVENGGEIFSHNIDVVTIENQYDYDFMYSYFTNNKKILTDNGFNVRGLIKAGGEGAIDKTTEIEKWLLLNYDYSNQGTAVNYSHDRIYLNQPVNTIKNIISDAITNKKWIQLYGHTLTGQEGYISESNLREILQYCKDNNVDIVTYSYIFDNYSSTKLENMINNI